MKQGKPTQDQKEQPARSVQHVGECKDDPHARQVCDGIYADRVDDVLELCEALMAIRTLCGGHSEQSKAITEIVDKAIEEHGI